MRWLVLLFGMYILFLGIVPCADGAVCDDLKVENTTQHNEHKDTDHKKQCTPFCSCSCCHSNPAITTFHLTESVPTFYLSERAQFHYVAGAAKDIAIEILRPPCMI